MGGRTVTTLLFLPSGDAEWRWMRVADARVEEGLGIPADDAPVIAIAPAEAVTLHWAELPMRSTAQGIAAARILAGEASASPLAELHVAVGDEGSAERPIGVVGAATMHSWLTMLASAGIDPLAIVPAPMLLPRPEQGYVRAELGGSGVVRGSSSGFADEDRLTELVTHGIAPETLDRTTLAASVARVADAPGLDLRQGPFARRKRFAIDWALVRRLVWLSVAVLSVTLAIDLVKIARYDFGADALQARADALAGQSLPRGETVTDPARQLDERLARVRGPGQGFSATTAAVFAAVRGLPGVDLTALDFQANGDVRIGVATDRESAATDLKRALEAAGFTVRAGVFQSNAGRVTGEMTVSPR
nr:type II secretion system protein GspL [Sphingomonas sp. CROZ-RG-20F-R02-07]